MSGPRLEEAAAGARERPRDRRLLPFGTLAALVVAADQVTKAWVDSSFGLIHAWGGASTAAAPTEVLGTFVRIAKSYNDGAIFGMFGASAPLFALGSAVVVAIILWYQVSQGDRGPWLLTVALSLLLGGAIGNLINRVTVGYVVDWADLGIGTWRWYTFNVADASVSVAIVLLVLVGVFGDRLDRIGRRGPTAAEPPEPSWPAG